MSPPKTPRTSFNRSPRKVNIPAYPSSTTPRGTLNANKSANANLVINPTTLGNSTSPLVSPKGEGASASTAGGEESTTSTAGTTKEREVDEVQLRREKAAVAAQRLETSNHVSSHLASFGLLFSSFFKTGHKTISIFEVLSHYGFDCFGLLDYKSGLVEIYVSP